MTKSSQSRSHRGRRPYLGHRRYRRGLIVGSACITAALVAAGCGSSGSGAAGSGGAKSPVKVGFLVNLTGTDIQYPDGLAGAKAAVRGINARGGIDGHPLQLEWCDVQSDVNTAESCARQMVSDGVAAVTGNQDNYGPQQTAIEQASGIPDIANDTMDASSEFTSPIEFPRSSGATGLFAAGVYYGLKVAKPAQKTFAFVGVQIPIVSALAQSTEQSVVKNGGVWKGSVEMPVTTTSFAPYVAAAASKHADITLLAMSGQQIAEFALAAEQAGDDFTTFSTAVAFPTSLLKTLDPTSAFARHMLFSADLPPWTATAQFPLLKQFDSDIQAEAKSGDKYAAPGYYSLAMLNAWYAVHMFAVVADQIHGTVDAKTMLTQLHKVSNLNFGLPPAWSPNVSGPPGFTRVSPSAWDEYMLTLVNGEFALAYPKPFSVEQFVAG